MNRSEPLAVNAPAAQARALEIELSEACGASAAAWERDLEGDDIKGDVVDFGESPSIRKPRVVDFVELLLRRRLEALALAFVEMRPSSA